MESTPLLPQTSGGGVLVPESIRRLEQLYGIQELPITSENTLDSMTDRSLLYELAGGSKWKREDAVEDRRAATSPDAAGTPRTLVPANCFPPSHPKAYMSSSEYARPGFSWGDDGSSTSSTTIAELADTLNRVSFRSDFNSRYKDRNRVSVDFSQHADSWLHPWESPAKKQLLFCGKGHIREDNVGEWKGVIYPRTLGPQEEFSPKVFLGGLPWEITEQALLANLKDFHPLRVEWPLGRMNNGAAEETPRGYGYVTFENAACVRNLLRVSRYDNGSWFYKVSSRKKAGCKEVQVIPWAIADSSWVGGSGGRLENGLTVFVGALHGMLTAGALAFIMNDLFDGVVYAGIDSDKNKYPIGSGRVAFNNARSYVRAVSSGYVEISTDKFNKRVQIDPYLDDAMCSLCCVQQGPYFCRDPQCYNYFCRACWVQKHPNDEHKPLSRRSKTSQTNRNSASLTSSIYCNANNAQRNTTSSGIISNGLIPSGVMSNEPSYTHYANELSNCSSNNFGNSFHPNNAFSNGVLGFSNTISSNAFMVKRSLSNNHSPTGSFSSNMSPTDTGAYASLSRPMAMGPNSSSLNINSTIGNGNFPCEARPNISICTLPDGLLCNSFSSPTSIAGVSKNVKLNGLTSDYSNEYNPFKGFYGDQDEKSVMKHGGGLWSSL